jgi:carbon storage regulator
MLVLTRKKEESVIVGGSNGVDPMVKVTVVEIGSGRVRLGFEAPAEMAVHRWEVWQRIHATARPHRPTEGSAASAA